MLVTMSQRFLRTRGMSRRASQNRAQRARRGIFQKRPDVHKIVLSIKLSPPPPEKVSILRIFYICTVFSSFWALFGGGGG